MRYRRFGNTEMNVSTLCIGGWQVGDYEAYGHTRETVVAMLHAALDLGVNFFDTAHWYAEGNSETVLGEVLAPVRERVYIATKVGMHRIDGVGYRDSRPGRIESHIDGALKRLQTDYVDLYQIHWPDPLVPFEESWEAMLRVQASGKARYIGVSNYSVPELQRCLSVGPVHGHQPCYHMFRRHLDRDLLPFCDEHGIGVLAYGPLAHGLLTGKYRPDAPPTWPPGDWRYDMPLFQGDGYLKATTAVVEMERIARDHGYSMAQLATAWAIAQRGITSVIAGAYTVAQIQDVIRGCDWELPAGMSSEVERILRRTPTYQELGGSDDVGGNNLRTGLAEASGGGGSDAD